MKLLHRNEDNRYEANGKVYTSGDYIEFYYDGTWYESNIEHDGNDYYIVGYSNISLDEVLVRDTVKVDR